MLEPGNGRAHRAYLWAYAPGAFEDLRAVVYDFCESRAGEHCRTFPGDWKGALVCDGFAGYKQSFTLGITEAGCLAHSRRKFFDLHVSNKSQIAQQALLCISQLYDIEREVKGLSADERRQIRQAKSKLTLPLLSALHRLPIMRTSCLAAGPRSSVAQTPLG